MKTETADERKQIKLLDETTICTIAAGEVIVSGAYAIKELIENSIDAGASNIAIEFKNAGLSLISITDDGYGMTRDDILLAVEHHATSKLRSVHDLKQIKTYGFRGEALPSIAAVSRCEILSSTDDAKPAVSVKIEGGEIKSLQPAAANKGTKITVKNLFYNTPVRKKFLKSENYENALIIEFVTRYALAHPEIKFSLFSNDREVFSTRADSTIANVIESIFPAEISSNLIKKNTSIDLGAFGTLSLNMLITPPHISRPNNRFQHYFINGRPFKNRSVSHAVYDAYQKYIKPKHYPAVFMFLELDQQHVDVNIHPSKTEVAFACEFAIHDAVNKFVNECLINPKSIPGNIKTGLRQNDDFTPDNIDENLFKSEPAENSSSYVKSLDIQQANFVLNKFFHEKNETCLNLNETQNVNNGKIEKNAQNKPDFQNISGTDASKNNEIEPIKIKKILGQSFDAFIIAEDYDGILIIDQHVAAEKVFYEKILSALQNKNFSSQSLLIPHVYDLTLSEFELLKENFDLFEKYGFEVEIFSNKTIAVRSVPDFLDGAEEKSLVYEIISAGLSAEKIDDDAFCSKLAARMACKSAIKAGKSITPETAALILDDLFKCKNPYFCPHGRPIIIKLHMKDLLAKFKRSL